MWPTVTFGDLAALCRRREYDLDYLVEHFRGAFGDKPGEVRDVCSRMLQGRHAAVVIPYAAVLTWYSRELGAEQLASGRERRCGCGCGQRVYGRKRWGSSACKQRGYRQRVVDTRNSAEKPAPLLTPTVTVSAGG